MSVSLAAAYPTPPATQEADTGSVLGIVDFVSPATHAAVVPFTPPASQWPRHFLKPKWLTAANIDDIEMSFTEFQGEELSLSRPSGQDDYIGVMVQYTPAIDSVEEYGRPGSLCLGSVVVAGYEKVALRPSRFSENPYKVVFNVGVPARVFDAFECDFHQISASGVGPVVPYVEENRFCWIKVQISYYKFDKQTVRVGPVHVPLLDLSDEGNFVANVRLAVTIRVGRNGEFLPIFTFREVYYLDSSPVLAPGEVYADS